MSAWWTLLYQLTSCQDPIDILYCMPCAIACSVDRSTPCMRMRMHSNGEGCSKQYCTSAPSKTSPTAAYLNLGHSSAVGSSRLIVCHNPVSVACMSSSSH
ncbi:hypothetical protein COO60DRAFT_22764 [Scenedesmus sp. NREL 46B-D3]|nr:hypothetical protein COO60DRAFT_22764 [Scenedesmus sp. NREL 46B-D3]